MTLSNDASCSMLSSSCSPPMGAMDRGTKLRKKKWFISVDLHCYSCTTVTHGSLKAAMMTLTYDGKWSDC
jgi:hypothetical protein